MHIRKTLNGGKNVAIIVRNSTEERLQTKCFRGTSLPLAGNFLRWGSSEELFHDPEVMEHLLTELNELWLKQEFGTHSVSIVHSLLVGWDSTAPLEDYSGNLLEDFDLNRRSWGLRVRLDCKDLRAPKTNKLTVVFEFKPEVGQVVAIVHSVYPGSDVGELDGDVTDREKRVFFDWNHPGAA